MIVHPHMRIRRLPSSAAMRPVFLLLFYFFLTVHAAVSVHPSNSSLHLSESSDAAFRIWGFNYLDGQHHLAPLTQNLLHLADQAKNLYLSGIVTKITNSNSLLVQSSQIACIPCDSSEYAGNLGVDWTVSSVLQAPIQPAAIVLYSTSATHCTFSTDEPLGPDLYVFTVTDHRTATALQQTFQSPNRSAHISSMSSFSSSGLGGAEAGTDTPNTAMVILYSITGIITALFLGIIITGAVRAHRHPERYGPRRVAGRPRQSRARGIARAMLDTIPIVKFDDDRGDGVAAAKRDLEMASFEHPASGSEENVTAVGQTTPRGTELSVAEERSDRLTGASESNPNHALDGGNFSCPICTDDFIKGQDLRVLPCNHQFHPECVDPWLVNVSGTCPLCRIDLNPPKEEDAEQEAEHNGEAPIDVMEALADNGAQNRHSRRLTNYLNARRMRNASVEERLAALRQVREANQGDVADEDGGARSSRGRLTRRLRERFRIRTRAHGVEGPSPVGSGTATPTVPAPAHIAPTGTNSNA